MLDKLQRETFDYFIVNTNPRNGLVADKTEPGSPASIAAVGLGLTALCVAAERGWVSRADVAARARVTLDFFLTSPQGIEQNATGHRGFYYHFLDMDTGRRALQCELSTIDTTFLLGGVLTAAAYLDGPDADEGEVRRIADLLVRRVDWVWACHGELSVGHGWTPEAGFLAHSWDQGYSEALLLYVLALGSPTFPIDPSIYRVWTSTFERRTFYGLDHIYAGPLFIHQLPQVWLDLRGIRDDLNRELDHDYFENTRRATLVQQRYAMDNPLGFAGYSENDWGLTASDGPGPEEDVVDGVRREFYGYVARGAPLGPDDGTISPWAVVASLPFAREIVCATLQHAIERLELKGRKHPGFDASFNSTFPKSVGNPHGWVSPWRFGLNEGPIVLMIENDRNDLIWRLFRRIPCVVDGLRRAGFRGGWLKAEEGDR